MPERTRWQMLQGLALSGGIVLLGVLFFLHLSWRTVFHYVDPGQMLVVMQRLARRSHPGRSSPKRPERDSGRGAWRRSTFVMPVSNETELHPVIDIPPGKIGVVTAKVGTDLPPGQVLAAARREHLAQDPAPGRTASTRMAMTYNSARQCAFVLASLVLSPPCWVRRPAALCPSWREGRAQGCVPTRALLHQSL